MSLFVTLAADALVAVLLVATIVTSIRLSRRIARLKSDETAMRQTVGDLVVATTTAERAITGLRAALAECDRTLADRLDNAERSCAELAGHVEAGEAVIARIGAIVSQSQAARKGGTREAEPNRRPEPVRPAPPRIRTVEPEPPISAALVSNGDRIDAALAAAQAISERALDRIRTRAA